MAGDSRTRLRGRRDSLESNVTDDLGNYRLLATFQASTRANSPTTSRRNSLHFPENAGGPAPQPLPNPHSPAPATHRARNEVEDGWEDTGSGWTDDEREEDFEESRRAPPNHVNPRSLTQRVRTDGLYETMRTIIRGEVTGELQARTARTEERHERQDSSPTEWAETPEPGVAPEEETAIERIRVEFEAMLERLSRNEQALESPTAAPRSAYEPDGPFSPTI